MFIGLMNSIDQWRFARCEQRLNLVMRRIEITKVKCSNFKAARKSLCQIKYAGMTSNVIYCNNMWVGLDRVDGLVKETEDLIVDLTHVQYEKLGTKCANLRRRISNRDAKIERRQLSGSSIA